jgi:hypothetical protein
MRELDSPDPHILLGGHYLSSRILSALCGFKVKPVTEANWYRSEGWRLPGLQDANSIEKVNLTAQTTDI